MSNWNYGKKGTRRKAQTSHNKPHQWTEKQMDVMEHCDDNSEHVTVNDFPKRTLSALEKKGYLVQVSSIVFHRTDDGLQEWNRRKIRDAERKKLEDLFYLWWQIHGDETVIFRDERGSRGRTQIIEGRDYAFDFVFPEYKVAVEIHGDIWNKGGHSSGLGLIRDYEKTRLANEAGWLVHTYTQNEMDSNSDGLSVIQSLMNVFRVRKRFSD